MNRYTQVPLSDTAKEIILGTILGDGSLKKQKRYANARLQFRHSEKDEAYFLWKANALHEIASDGSVAIQKPDGYSPNRKLRFMSRALSALSQLHELTHEKNTLRIKRKWLNAMSSLSLAVWWCDDGSLVGEGGRKGVLCTDGFDYKSVKLLARYLEVVWHVHTTVAPVRRSRDGKRDEYWRLWISSTEELKTFLRIIIPHIPVPGMLRKVLLLYNDSHMQQRWISEVVELSQFDEQTVLRELSFKKAKRKAFQKKI
jgi:hypothetical protein